MSKAGKQQVIYKHAISTMAPIKPVKLQTVQ
ncbi:RNA chaperone Hfq [Paenibacillus alginolyticus]